MKEVMAKQKRKKLLSLQQGREVMFCLFSHRFYQIFKTEKNNKRDRGLATRILLSNTPGQEFIVSKLALWHRDHPNGKILGASNKFPNLM